jgi:hypothetical protein
MPMSNYYSQVDMRASADFGQSIYTAPDSIRMKIAPNMASSPHVASNALYLVSLVYSRVEESSANTLGLGTNRSDFDKGYDTELEAKQLKLEEAFMAHYGIRPMRYRVVHPQSI